MTGNNWDALSPLLHIQNSGLVLFCNSSHTCTPMFSLQVHVLTPVHTQILAIAKSLLKHGVHQLIRYSLSTVSMAVLCSLLSFLPVFFPTQVLYPAHSSVVGSMPGARPKPWCRPKRSRDTQLWSLSPSPIPSLRWPAVPTLPHFLMAWLQVPGPPGA